jgi:hypothetical protein
MCKEQIESEEGCWLSRSRDGKVEGWLRRAYEAQVRDYSRLRSVTAGQRQIGFSAAFNRQSPSTSAFSFSTSGQVTTEVASHQTSKTARSRIPQYNTSHHITMSSSDSKIQYVRSHPILRATQISLTTASQGTPGQAQKRAHVRRISHTTPTNHPPSITTLTHT